MKKIALFSIIIFGLALSVVYLDFEHVWATIFADCDRKLLQKPTEYQKGSEQYYLSWIEHGDYGQKAIAAKNIFESGKIKEVKITEHLCICEKEQVVKNYLILALFELKPDKYLKRTQNLLIEKDKTELNADSEGTWVKAGKFEDDDIDFYFDWGKEASLKLLAKGYISERSLFILFAVARSFYSDDRERAAKIFELFDGIPKVDLLKQRERYDGQNPFEIELNGIEAWIAKNKENISWDSKKQRNFIK